MRLKNLMVYVFIGCTVASCIKEEGPNAEADIETCTVPGDVLNRTPIIGDEQITLILKTTSFHFEETIPYVGKDGSTIYYNFRETDVLGNYMDWTNANAGFNYTGVNAAPEDYPTSPASNGVKGNCVKLTTKSTGFWGATLKMYIAAGNLFTGSFQIVIPEVVKATKFGIPFTHIPTALKGYYKYKAGAEFSVGGQVVSGRKDICDIYGVFYETDDKVETLDGTNIFTSPNIVSIARIDNAKESDQWIEFNLPFVTKPGKTIDIQKLE